MTRRRRRLTFTFLGIVMLNSVFIQKSYGLEKIEEASGPLQIWGPGYTQRTYGETYHATELSGVKEVTLEEPSYEYEEKERIPEIWRIYRSAGFSTEYDSNIFGSRIDPIGDFIYTWRGRFGLGRREKRYYIKMFYDISYYRYAQWGKENNYNHSQTTEFGYTFNRLTINFSNTCSPHRNVVVGENTWLGAAGDRTTSVSDSAGIDINYKVSPKTTASFLYYYSLTSYPPGSNTAQAVQFGNQTHTFGPQISYQVTPKTLVYSRFLLETIDYFGDQQWKYWSNYPSVGIATRLNPKTSFSFDAGYRTWNYKDSFFGDVNGLDLRAAIFRRITPKISGSIYASRSTDQDFDANRGGSLTRLTEGYGVNLGWALSPKMSLDVQADVTYYSGEGYQIVIDPDNSTNRWTQETGNQNYHWAVGWNWHPRPFMSFFLGYDYTNYNDNLVYGAYEKHRAVGSIDIKY